MLSPLRTAAARLLEKNCFTGRQNSAQYGPMKLLLFHEFQIHVAGDPLAKVFKEF